MKYQLGIILTLASSLVLAQQGGIGAIKFDPATVRAGQEVKITIAAEGEAPGFCGMVVHFDDGSESRNIKIDGKEGKFPVTIAKTFAKAGTYSIKAEGKKITTHFPCIGSSTAKLVVDAAPAAAAPVAACPEGFKMTGKAGKAGDFSCKGGKGAMAPAKPITCASGLEYFANDKARQVGCRKMKAQKK